MKNKSTPEDLRKRLWFSLISGMFLLMGIVMAFHLLKTAENEGAYSLHRQAFLYNEQISRWLFDAKRMSVTKPTPTKGTPPRVNGDIGLLTPVDLENYQVEVESGEKKVKLSIPEFYLLPKSAHSTDFRCIEGWSEVMQYAGVKFSDFMKAYDLGKKQDGSYYSYVGFQTPDRKYYVSLDMESMLHPQTLLAYEMNLAPLRTENGKPLRLIIPIKYGIKSLKRIGRIFFSDTRPPDYWAERGYDWYSGL